jgi:hypothetical protein
LNLIAFDPREISLVGEFYAATMESQMPDSWVVAGMLGSRVVAGVLDACKNVWWSPKPPLAAFILVVAKRFGGRRKPYWLHLFWWSPECLVVATTPIG